MFKKYFLFVLVFLFLFFAESVGQYFNFSYPANYSVKAFVSRVIDGDTFVLSDSQHVRMLGVNCPEIARFNKPAELYSLEAKQKTKSLIEHKIVKLTFESISPLTKGGNTTCPGTSGKGVYDIFGRLLAYVWLTDSKAKDSLFVQAELLKSGLSRISYYNKQKKYYALFYNLRRTAMKNKIGIWSIR